MLWGPNFPGDLYMCFIKHWCHVLIVTIDQTTKDCQVSPQTWLCCAWRVALASGDQTTTAGWQWAVFSCEQCRSEGACGRKIKNYVNSSKSWTRGNVRLLSQSLCWKLKIVDSRPYCWYSLPYAKQERGRCRNCSTIWGGQNELFLRESKRTNWMDGYRLSPIRVCIPRYMCLPRRRATWITSGSHLGFGM